MQTSLLGIAFGLILAFFVALFGPMFVDWNARKPWIEAEASRIFAMPVKLGGPVTLRLLPIPTLELEDVTLGQGAQSVSLGAVFGELRLAPLLRGEIIMERTALVRPVLRLSLPLRPGQTSGLPSIDELGIEWGTLILVDAKGEETRIDGLNLVGESSAAGLKLAGKATLAGEPATTTLLYSAPTGNERGRLRLRVERQQAIIEADGAWDGAADMAFDGQFSVNMPTPAGRLHFRAPLQASPLRQVMGLGEGELRQDAATLNFSAEGEIDRVSGTFAAELQSRAVDADVLIGRQSARQQVQMALDAIGATSLVKSLPTSGDLRLQINQLKLGGASFDRVDMSLRREPSGWRIGQFQTRLPGEGSLVFKGQVQDDALISGDVRIDLVRPAALAQALDDSRAVVAAAVDPVRFEARVISDARQITASSASVITAAGPMTGRIVFDLQTPAVLRAEMTAKTLDLEVLARTLAAINGLAPTRVDVALAAESASFGELMLGDLRLSALRQDGTVQLRELVLSSNEGEAALTGSLSLGTPLKGQLDGRLRLSETNGPWRQVLLQGLALPQQGREILAGAGELLVTGRGSWASDTLSIAAEGLLGDGPVTFQMKRAASGFPRSSDVTWSRPDLGAALGVLTGQKAPAFGAPASLSLTSGRKGADVQDMVLKLQHPVLDLTMQGEGDAAAIKSGTLLLRSDDLGKAALALGFLAEDAPGALPLDVQGSWRVQPQGYELTGRGQFDRKPFTGAITSGQGSITASLRASSLDGTVLAAALMAPAFRQTGGTGLSLDIGVESLAIFGEAIRDLSLLVTGTAQRRLIDIRSMRLNNAEKVTGQIQLVPLAGHLAASGNLTYSEGKLASFWPGAVGDLTASASFGGEGGDVRSLASSLLGTLTISGKGWSVPGLNPLAFARARRAAEENHDLGKPMDEGRLARIFRDEAGKMAVIGSVDLKGSINSGLMRLSLPVIAVDGGAITGQAALDIAGGNLRFEGAILPEGGGAILPRVPVTIDTADNLFRAQYGLDDMNGWLTLQLLDREEDRIGMSEADRLERVRQRLRLDRQIRPRSPVRSPERFIPPR